MVQRAKSSVTLVLVTYRQEPFVAAAVRSTLSQVGGPWDILVSDDSSPDSTFEIIQREVARYRGPNRVRVRRTKSNVGLISHIGECMREVQSDWVIFGAGDDEFFPDRARRITEVIAARPDLSGAFSASSYIDEAGKEASPSLSSRLSSFLPAVVWPRVTQRGRVLGTLAVDQRLVLGATAAWRTSLWREFPEVYAGCAEDVVLGLRAAMLGGVAYLRSPLVKYRRHSSNVWSSTAPDDREAQQARRARHTLMLQRSFDQHLADVQFARERGIIDNELFELATEAIRVKRDLADLRCRVSPETARVMSSVLATTALLVRGHSLDRPRRMSRIRGWGALLVCRAVSYLLSRDLRLR